MRYVRNEESKIIVFEGDIEGNKIVSRLLEGEFIKYKHSFTL